MEKGTDGRAAGEGFWGTIRFVTGDPPGDRSTLLSSAVKALEGRGFETIECSEPIEYLYEGSSERNVK